MRRVRLYDTRHREVRLFQPRFPPRVGMFVCGLTTYDDAHIGHGRFAVVFDVLARALRQWGYRVFYVQNVTNLDDKVIARAAEAGEDPLERSARYFRSWRSLMDRMRVTSVDHYPFATDYIPEIIEQIEQLERGGYAYRAEDGSVYYAVSRFASYGRLSGQEVASLRPGARIERDPRKRSAEDFVLWKAATPGEPSWESPWGPGRPGWHIEDTAITGRLLGPQYDIHGGGIDLLFPHHEAEIAQAEGASGRSPLVEYWMHNGLVRMDGEKMSKSLGNVASLEAALSEYGAMPLRLYYLNAHYRSPLDFRPRESLAEARESYGRLRTTYDRLALRARVAPENGAALPADLEQASADTVAAMDDFLADDLRTREAIATLFQWTRTIHELRDVDAYSAAAIEALMGPFRWAETMLGLFPESGTDSPPKAIGGAVEVAIRARSRARQRGDFPEADRIRDELRAVGVDLEDGPDGTRWSLRLDGG
ncbi:MAG: cysteine--tRNA ligase [Thermoplasmata archaeon]